MKEPFSQTTRTRRKLVSRLLAFPYAHPVWLGFLALVSAYGLILSFEWGIQGDTASVIQGARSLLQCAALQLGSGNWQPCPEAGQFSFLQVGLASFGVGLGWRDGTILRVLAALNLIACLDAVRLGFRLLRGSRWNQLIWLAIWIGGCLPWYARTSFTEPLAAWLFLRAHVAGPGHPIRYGLLLAGATLTKETAWIVSLALLLDSGLSPADSGLNAAAEAKANPRQQKSPRGLLVGASAVLIGVVLHFTFNLFRFGTWKNVPYLHPAHFVPDFSTRISFFQGIWLSPLGGVAFFLPIFFWLFLGETLRLLKSVIQRDRLLCGRLLIPILLPLLQSAVLSGWFAPLGWKTWGPRLMLPIIPLASLMLLRIRMRLSVLQEKAAGTPSAGAAPLMEGSLKQDRIRVRALTFLAFGLGFIHLKAVFDHQALDRLLKLPLPECANVIVELQPQRYYACTQEALQMKWIANYLAEWGNLPAPPYRIALFVIFLALIVSTWAITTKRQREDIYSIIKR